MIILDLGHNMKRLIAEGKFDKEHPVTVSEQNLIDCSAEKFGSIGCDGGMPQQAWKYVAANGGVSSVESYPYKGKVCLNIQNEFLELCC
jgi:hypothetical protein